MHAQTSGGTRAHASSVAVPLFSLMVPYHSRDSVRVKSDAVEGCGQRTGDAALPPPAESSHHPFMTAARSEPALDASFVLVDPISSTIFPPKPINHEGLSTTSVSRPVVSRDLPLSHPSQQETYDPGSSDGYAHDWSSKSMGDALRIRRNDLVDQYGRVCLPRGVNLSGNCKSCAQSSFYAYGFDTDVSHRPVNDDNVPWPDGYRTATFVGRPFPLEEAPEHLSRLRRWGLTFSKPAVCLIHTMYSLKLSHSSVSCHMGGRPTRQPVSRSSQTHSTR